MPSRSQPTPTARQAFTHGCTHTRASACAHARTSAGEQARKCSHTHTNAALKLVLRRIERFQAEAGPAAAPDMPVLSLEAMLALLEADDVGAPVAWRGLAPTLSGRADAALLGQLDTLIENFDFAAAMPLLRELIAAQSAGRYP